MPKASVRKQLIKAAENVVVCHDQWQIHRLLFDEDDYTEDYVDSQYDTLLQNLNNNRYVMRGREGIYSERKNMFFLHV